jgi:UPF0042 nucleotide-binding protein
MKYELELTIVTGMSGAGRSTAAHALEDLGYMVIDNLPPQLLRETIDLIAERNEVSRLAVVIDSRGGSLFSTAESAIDEVRSEVSQFSMVFLEATDQVLIRRFESARRPHPLQSVANLLEAVVTERSMLLNLRESADLLIDTTDKNVHDLRRAIDKAFDGDKPQIRLTISSFGFKYGIPIDADYVFDVRFLPNPFWVPELRHLTGADPQVRDYVLSQPEAQPFVEMIQQLFEVIRSGYIREGKRFVSIAMGCTGGQHRSVAMAQRLADILESDSVSVHVVHRDRGRE